MSVCGPLIFFKTQCLVSTPKGVLQPRNTIHRKTMAYLFFDPPSPDPGSWYLVDQFSACFYCRIKKAGSNTVFKENVFDQ